jgi:predicted transcriptional regulator
MAQGEAVNLHQKRICIQLNIKKKDNLTEQEDNLTEQEELQFKQELSKLKKHSKDYESFEKDQTKLKVNYVEFIRDYTDYLPEKDKENLRSIEIVKVPQDIVNVCSY